jgi:Zn-dependent protease
MPKVTIGRISQIPVRIDITFLIVPYLLFSALSGRPVGEHWQQMAAVTIGVFLSIFLHELGHALTAKLYRVSVVEIVVGGFYGYASMKKMAVSRLRAMAILAAGPAANLAIFTILWLALSTPSFAELIPRGLRWPAGGNLEWLSETLRLLVFLNLLMFAFNLLPFFPLDGGKLFGLVLNRFYTVVTSVRIVSVLSIIFGAIMALYGFGSSIFMVIIGVMIVTTNLSRLRLTKTR